MVDQKKPYEPYGSKNLLVLFVDTISPGAKAWLQNERVGYYDSGGSLFLPTDDTYILIDRPQTKKQTKSTGSVFEGRRAGNRSALGS